MDFPDVIDTRYTEHCHSYKTNYMNQPYFKFKDTPIEQVEYYHKVTSMETPFQNFIELVNTHSEITITLKNELDKCKVKMTVKDHEDCCHYIEQIFEKPLTEEAFERAPKQLISALFSFILDKKYGIK